MAAVLINVTRARRGESSISVKGDGVTIGTDTRVAQLGSADAFELGRDLQIAADWASELEAKAAAESDAEVGG